jgi:hypothetical protein
MQFKPGKRAARFDPRAPVSRSQAIWQGQADRNVRHGDLALLA